MHAKAEPMATAQRIILWPMLAASLIAIPDMWKLANKQSTSPLQTGRPVIDQSELPFGQLEAEASLVLV